jgi:hypothetical protein
MTTASDGECCQSGASLLLAACSWQRCIVAVVSSRRDQHRNHYHVVVLDFEKALWCVVADMEQSTTTFKAKCLLFPPKIHNNPE